jgi:hypothetical protein
LTFHGCRYWPVLMALLIGFAAGTSTAQQQPSATDSSGSVDPGASKPVEKIELPVEVVAADTIPGDFFEIVENLGLHSYTKSLLTSLVTIPDELILKALASADQQTDHLRANAYLVTYVIRSISQQNNLWKNFFYDLDLQLKEPNIISFNFLDNQKWKSYALNELFYSPAFQELLLIMGNLGISESKDGRQWLAGWPLELRWKYREYRIEYIPEDQKIKLIESIQQPGATPVSTGSSLRLEPASPILETENNNSAEPPYKVPRL